MRNFPQVLKFTKILQNLPGCKAIIASNGFTIADSFYPISPWPGGTTWRPAGEQLFDRRYTVKPSWTGTAFDPRWPGEGICCGPGWHKYLTDHVSFFCPLLT